LFSLGTPFSSINKTDRHDITEILLCHRPNQTIQLLLYSLFVVKRPAANISCTFRTLTILTKSKNSTKKKDRQPGIQLFGLPLDGKVWS
jgi:hypothetical protein